MRQPSYDYDSAHHTDQATLMLRALFFAKITVARLHDAINIAFALGIQLQRCAALWVSEQECAQSVSAPDAAYTTQPI